MMPMMPPLRSGSLVSIESSSSGGVAGGGSSILGGGGGGGGVSSDPYGRLHAPPTTSSPQPSTSTSSASSSSASSASNSPLLVRAILLVVVLAAVGMGVWFYLTQGPSVQRANFLGDMASQVDRLATALPLALRLKASAAQTIAGSFTFFGDDDPAALPSSPW